MTKAVFFDWDDTLVHSLPSRVKTLEMVFEDAGIPVKNAREFLLATQGGSLKTALARLAQAHGVTANLFDSYRRIYWFELNACATLFPGIKEMLGNLKNEGLILAIVTGKFRHLEFEGRRIGCSLEIKRTGLDDMFSLVIGLEDVKEPKPAPECIHLALSRLDLEAGDVLMVGDSAGDIAAAKAAGCLSCRALWGIDNEDGNIAPDFTARAPDDVIRIVNRRR